MAQRNRNTVPEGRLIDIGSPPSSPRSSPFRPPARTPRARGPRSQVQDVPCGSLIDISHSYEGYDPPNPPVPSPVPATGPVTPMRYKPVIGKHGRMQVMFNRDYYEDIERRYPKDPLTWPEMSLMYEYPHGSPTGMGPWFRDPLDSNRQPWKPGRPATGFDSVIEQLPDPYGTQWFSEHWDQVTTSAEYMDEEEREEQRAKNRYFEETRPQRRRRQ